MRKNTTVGNYTTMQLMTPIRTETLLLPHKLATSYNHLYSNLYTKCIDPKNVQPYILDLPNHITSYLMNQWNTYTKNTEHYPTYSATPQYSPLIQ